MEPIPDIADLLAEHFRLILATPEPAREPLLASHRRLTEAVAGFMRFVMEKDQLLQTELRKLAASVKEQVGDVAVGMAYIDFDLDATRRERDQLKRELGDPDGLQE